MATFLFAPEILFLGVNLKKLPNEDFVEKFYEAFQLFFVIENFEIIFQPKKLDASLDKL